MELVIGLGPIGGNVAHRLLEVGREVVGLDLDPARAKEWGRAHGAKAVSSFDDVPWESVDTVLVAVRLAPQVKACFDELAQRITDTACGVYVLTTLKVNDARDLLDGVSWARVFEAPLSGGPKAAKQGTMTLLVAGPESTPDDEKLLRDIAERVFRLDGYGTPAVLKLTNNTLGAFNAIATATMLRTAAEHGVAPDQFLKVVSVSSGQSWMSDNFHEFHHDLLFKDAHLWQEEWGTLPDISLTPSQPELSAFIEAARATTQA